MEHSLLNILKNNANCIFLLLTLVISSGCNNTTQTAKTGVPKSCENSCPAGDICLDGACLPALLVCNNSSPCNDGRNCCGGICTIGTCCSLDTECGTNGQCIDNTCTDSPRATCNAETACTDGVCLLSSGQCVECIYNEDCAHVAGTVCSPAHQCIPTGSGCTAIDCSTGGQICAPEEGNCRDCVSHAECGDQLCTEGRCTPCTAQDTCGFGRACHQGRCATEPGISCTNQNECAGICIGGNCARCLLHSECGANKSCHDGICVATSPNCANDIDCNPPNTICNQGLCEAGCLASNSCASGQSCNAVTGRCTVRNDGSRSPLGTVCASFNDCNSGICWPVLTATGPLSLCSSPCAGSADCPSDSYCLELGDANLCWPISVSFAPPLPTLSDLPGTLCGTTLIDTHCRTGYCGSIDDIAPPVCLEMCGRDGDCPMSQVCISGYAVNTPQKMFTQLCAAPMGGLPAQAPCGANAYAVSAAENDSCQSGWCAQTPDKTILPRCAQPCCSPSDCQSPISVCKPMDVYDGVRDLSSEPFGFQKICLSHEYTGTKNSGELCSLDSECKSEICIAGPSGDKRCTQTCCRNDDCAGFDWASGCRPPFGGDTSLADPNFAAMATSLGRQGMTSTNVFSTSATAAICMPQ